MKKQDYSTKSLGKKIVWEYNIKRRGKDVKIKNEGIVKKINIDTKGKDHFLTAYFESIGRNINIAPESVIKNSNINAMYDKEFKIIK